MTRCWAYCLAYNEATIIPYWVRHYRTFCERVIVYQDTDTDDGTGGYALLEGGEVRSHALGGLDDLAFTAFAQEHYTEARGRADWVIWTDADELLWHPRGAGVRLHELRSQGVTYPHVLGYAMLADAPPDVASDNFPRPPQVQGGACKVCRGEGWTLGHVHQRLTRDG